MAHTFCDRLEDIGKAEAPFIKKEIEFHKLILSQINRRDVGSEVAEGDYLSKHLPWWAYGFAAVFCLDYCKGETCQAYHIKQKKFKNHIENYRKSLSLEKEDVSYEEAEKRFLYTPEGFSYAMGMAHAHLFLQEIMPKTKLRRLFYKLSRLISSL